MAATTEFYEQVVSAFPDAESLTVLVASGVTRDEVLTGLGADLSDPAEGAWDFSERSAAWAAVDVPGGVLAVELSGYGDPSLADLAALSKAGAAAVVRSNIQAHYRFGCSRAGEVAFDDDEFIYVDDPSSVPAELRPLFDAAWDNLDDEDEDEDEERAEPLATGLAMAELVTGVELTEDLVASVLEADFFLAPSLRYPGSDAGEDGEEEAEDEPAPPVKVKLERGVRKVDEGWIWTWTQHGRYMLTSDWDFMFERAEELPEGAPESFGLVAAEHTAWVRSMSENPMVQVSLTALSSQQEPTSMLEKLRAAYTHEASGVVGARGHRSGLDAWGEPEYGQRSIRVTEGEGSFVLHVFARRVRFEEEHVIVTWPASERE